MWQWVNFFDNVPLADINFYLMSSQARFGLYLIKLHTLCFQTGWALARKHVCISSLKASREVPNFYKMLVFDIFPFQFPIMSIGF